MILRLHGLLIQEVLLRLEQMNGSSRQDGSALDAKKSSHLGQWHYLKKKTADYVVIPAKAGIQGLKKTSADRPVLDASFRWHDGNSACGGLKVAPFSYF